MFIEIISFLGLVIGYLLAKNIKEELIPGKKWFLILSRLMLLILIIILLKFNFEFLIALIIGIILNYFIKKIYLFLGLILALNINNILLSLIVFIFGLAYGTLEYIKFNKINYRSVLINFILFIMPILILFNKFTMIYNNVLTGLAVGGMIIELFRTNSGFKEKKRTSRSRR